MPGEIGIKVAVISRPWTGFDKAGVRMVQNAEESGEVEMLNSKYTTTRYGFTWSWYSAYNWKKYLSGAEGKSGEDSPPSPKDLAACEEMVVSGQEHKYKSCGKKIMENLMSGDAVVMFAYGLSGSGKTFTVFGPDAVDAPEAWFKHDEPHDLWGIFPRLAYELFQLQSDGWKITMKYFQNIVDIVRDLMDPLGKEETYKSGMRKDKDGFMDITWCKSKTLTSWKELRETFQEANARKAISPTQFNHQSTRGHCIMVLEVEMPDPNNKGRKQKGRVYVCDLAGTEPAGDIVSAKYEKKVFPDGTIEHIYLGPHDDKSKTKELQDQGKKINLSLSEMRQFFMKMAAAVKKKKLKAGSSIPGCNSYFLCKFLKDTMLQSKTYLFCAIRPEAKFLNYTRDTLNFAKDASVIKLKPKKATTAVSAKEKKLMEELERMREMMKDLEGKQGGGGVDEEQMQAMIKAKQDEMMREMMGEAEKAQALEAEKERKKFMDRGIALTTYERGYEGPYLTNLDADAAKHRRFMILLHEGTNAVGRDESEIRPFNLHVVAQHCALLRSGDDVTLEGGNGPVYHNGRKIKKGKKDKVAVGDRVVIAQDIYVLCHAAKESEGQTFMDAADASKELHDGMIKYDSEYKNELAKQERERKAQREKLEKELERLKRGGSDEAELERKQAEMAMWSEIDTEMMKIVPAINDLKSSLEKLGRGNIALKLSLQQPKETRPEIKIHVQNVNDTGVATAEAFLAPVELERFQNLVGQQITSLMSCNVQLGEEFTVPAEEDIASAIFDSSFQVGAATNFLLHTAVLMATEEDESSLDVMKSVIPYNKIGTLDVTWTPCNDPEDLTLPEIDILDPSEWTSGEYENLNWCYMVKIKQLTGLPFKISEAHIEFTFRGEVFTTPPVVMERGSRSAVFNYETIIFVEAQQVTEEFIDMLQEDELKFEVHVKPWVHISHLNPISTEDLQLCDRLEIHQGVVRPDKVRLFREMSEALEQEMTLLKDSKPKEAAKVRAAYLEAQIAELEQKIGSKTKIELAKAQAMDAVANAVSPR